MKRADDGFTEADIPRQTGKVFAITGANSGLGFLAAKLLGTKAEGVLLRALARPMEALFGQPPQKAVLPTLLCATAPDVDPGGLYGPTGSRGLRGRIGRIAPEPWATDPEAMARLWSVTLDRTGAKWKVFGD